jgi:prevent-host-death family protein
MAIMTGAVNVRGAKRRFSELLKRVQLGEEIVIAKDGKPVARLIPFVPAGLVRKPGTAKGMITISDDFDAPLPADLFVD